MREEFPVFQKHPELIYFDSAATTQKPRCVIDALTQFYSEEYATVHRAVYQYATKAEELYNASRVEAAKFLHASPEEIVFTKGTTDAINLVALSYGRTFLQAGDEVLVSEMEHHSNLVPWQMLAKEKGLILKTIPVNLEGVLEWEGTISDRTKLVAIVHVSNVLGTINPIQQITEEAHRKGAVVVVDGAQAAPHTSIDVKALDVDFYAFSAHKCYGPTGVGVLYGKKDLLDKMPPIYGGGDMIEEVSFTETTYQTPPLRFEAGTPNIAGVVALKSALEFTKKHQKPSTLCDYALAQLRSIPGLKILGQAPERGSLITFNIEGVHSLDLATLLDLKHIAIRSGHMCAQPLLRKFGLESAARVSFGIYNTSEEVDLFSSALKKSLLSLA